MAYDLNVQYTEGTLWNPTEGRNDKVHLRSYTGDGVYPDAPYVAPTIEVRPGQTVRMSSTTSCRPIRACTAHGGS